MLRTNDEAKIMMCPFTKSLCNGNICMAWVYVDYTRVSKQVVNTNRMTGVSSFSTESEYTPEKGVCTLIERDYA